MFSESCWQNTVRHILENGPKQWAAVTTYWPSQMSDPPQMCPVPLPPSRGFHSPLQVGPFHPSHWRPNETIHGQSCSFLISHPPTIFSQAGRFSFLFFSAPRDPSKAEIVKLIKNNYGPLYSPRQFCVTFGSMSLLDLSFLAVFSFLFPSSSIS